MMAASDQWSRWILERRDAGDARQRAITLERLAPIRDRVLAGAGRLDGATVLDVGTGDGLIALEALNHVGPSGIVIFSDVSEALLNHVRAGVCERGLLERARFALADAADLDQIGDGSVDVVTSRSVLIYVPDKVRAFAAMHRVLRPGGRISLFEPINRLTYPEPDNRFWGYDVTEVRSLAGRVTAAYVALVDRPAASMVDFDDRDLVRFAEESGFERIHLECHIDIGPGGLTEAVDIDALLGSSPNPLAPTLGEAIASALEPDEQARFIAHLAEAIETGGGIRRSAVAYLTARKREGSTDREDRPR